MVWNDNIHCCNDIFSGIMLCWNPETAQAQETFYILWKCCEGWRKVYWEDEVFTASDPWSFFFCSLSTWKFLNWTIGMQLNILYSRCCRNPPRNLLNENPRSERVTPHAHLKDLGLPNASSVPHLRRLNVAGNSYTGNYLNWDLNPLFSLQLLLIEHSNTAWWVMNNSCRGKKEVWVRTRQL